MNYHDFEFVAGLVTERTGVEMKADKAFLLEGRLSPLARREGLVSIEDLIHVMRSRKEERLIGGLVDALIPNETSFFRDRAVFAALRARVLPELVAARKSSRVRILCAGCSTGQEAYSIALMLDQNLDLAGGTPIEIIATDISDRCLERARQGLYTQFEVQRGLPIRMLMQYFTQHDEHWRLSETIRSRVSFKKHNLLQPIGDLGSFDLVLCRNVLGGFHRDLANETLNKLCLQLNDGGFFMLGAGETLGAQGQGFAQTGADGLFKLSASAVNAA